MASFKVRQDDSNQASLARQIVDRVQPLVIKSLGGNAAEMSVAELRGYVRARAVAIVSQQARAIAGELCLSELQTKDLAADVVDITVHAIVRDFTTPPVQSIPIPHVLRRAA